MWLFLNFELSRIVLSRERKRDWTAVRFLSQLGFECKWADGFGNELPDARIILNPIMFLQLDIRFTFLDRHLELDVQGIKIKYFLLDIELDLGLLVQNPVYFFRLIFNSYHQFIHSLYRSRISACANFSCNRTCTAFHTIFVKKLRATTIYSTS